jgi:hypothetical protein
MTAQGSGQILFPKVSTQKIATLRVPINEVEHGTNRKFHFKSTAVHQSTDNYSITSVIARCVITSRFSRNKMI